MTRLLIAALAAMLLPAPTFAQVDFRYDEVLSTRFGDIHAVGSDYQFTLWHNQTQLPLPENARWWVQWASEPAQGDIDWVLAAHHHGGNSCGGGYFILQVSASGVVPSREISDCDGRLMDIRFGEDWIEIDRLDRDIEVALTTIRWQGDAYSETYHYAPPEAPAGPGDDVTRWIGEHAYSILQDASERARFGMAMQIWDMQDLAIRLSVGNSVVQAGDWVVGTGCMPHACGLEIGAIGMRISDGAVAAIIQSHGEVERAFGLARDPVFRAAVAEGLQ
ncbi:hypothetical protein K3728_15755 [Rhodobacteraceae bacterium M385]|nr:hypothetical protein K3728_15755 [Rhodobacteraceae bacterium M385]